MHLSAKQSKYNRNRFLGFTVAEVLTTLLIIGVVASLTVPPLFHNYQESVMKARFRKAYQQLNTAWGMAVVEEPNKYTGRGGWSCTWPDGVTQNYNISDRRDDALLKQLNNLKRCAADECWPDEFEYSSIDLYAWNSQFIYDNVYKTPDNMCISFSGYRRDEVHLILDTNCKKGPNKLGEDIYSLLLGADGVIYFLTDSKATNDKPVKDGHVCPYGNNISGKTYNLRRNLFK